MLNMIETVFLISLAITFVLILLMVYHFNQRVAALETSSSSMVELVHSFADKHASCGTFTNSAKIHSIQEEDEDAADAADAADEDDADDAELSYSSGDDDENCLDVDDDVSIKKISIPVMMNMLPIPVEFYNMFHAGITQPQYNNEFNGDGDRDRDEDDDAEYMDMPELESMKDATIEITDDLPVMDDIPVPAQNVDTPVDVADFVDIDETADVDTDAGVCLDADADGCFDAADFTDARNLDADPDADPEDDDEPSQPFNESAPLNYQKQSVHQLRMIVVSRGLNTNIDVNKLKKNELVRILSA